MRAIITDPLGNTQEIEIEAIGVPPGEPLPDGAWGLKCSEGKWVIERIECPEDVQTAIKEQCTPWKVETLCRQS